MLGFRSPDTPSRFRVANTRRTVAVAPECRRASGASSPPLRVLNPSDSGANTGAGDELNRRGSSNPSKGINTGGWPGTLPSRYHERQRGGAVNVSFVREPRRVQPSGLSLCAGNRSSGMPLALSRSALDRQTRSLGPPGRLCLDLRKLARCALPGADAASQDARRLPEVEEVSSTSIQGCDRQ